jgi:hypothetical protein
MTEKQPEHRFSFRKTLLINYGILFCALRYIQLKYDGADVFSNDHAKDIAWNFFKIQIFVNFLMLIWRFWKFNKYNVERLILNIFCLFVLYFLTYLFLFIQIN